MAADVMHAWLGSQFLEEAERRLAREAARGGAVRIVQVAKGQRVDRTAGDARREESLLYPVHAEGALLDDTLHVTGAGNPALFLAVSHLQVRVAIRWHLPLGGGLKVRVVPVHVVVVGRL